MLTFSQKEDLITPCQSLYSSPAMLVPGEICETTLRHRLSLAQKTNNEV